MDELAKRIYDKIAQGGEASIPVSIEKEYGIITNKRISVTPISIIRKRRQLSKIAKAMDKLPKPPASILSAAIVH